MKYLKNDSGLSLVEVVASVFILTILLTSFLGLLLSAAKSTQQASEIVDYTFIAQRNMEIIYQRTNDYKLSELDSLMIDELNYLKSSSNANSSAYMKDAIDINEELYEIKVTFYAYEPEDQFANLAQSLSKVVVEVFPEGESRSSATVENLLEWGG